MARFLRNLILTGAAGAALAAAVMPAAAAEGGGSVEWIACDVSEEAQVEAAVEAVAKAAGRIDALVNNAGVTRDGLVFRMSLEDWNKVIGTNLTSAFLVCRAAARHVACPNASPVVLLAVQLPQLLLISV